MTGLFDLQHPTPLLDLSSLVPRDVRLLAKAEFLNPGMSLKDRIARNIISRARERGDLKPGDTIVCASSGNTGCSVAAIGRAANHPVIVVTTHKCSAEKLAHVRSYGAQIQIAGERDYMQHGDDLAAKHGYFNIAQYSNPDNPEAYETGLAGEIWDQTEGRISHFVMTGSTFGCITGTSRGLKARKPEVRTYLADPEKSHMHYHFTAAKEGSPLNSAAHEPMEQYLVEGAGKSKPTPCLDWALIDGIFKVSDTEAISMCHRMAHHMAILTGGSSGLNVAAAIKLAENCQPGDVIVTVLCDHGVKYLSKIYNTDFLRDHGISAGGI